jgi:hypothetical protein
MDARVKPAHDVERSESNGYRRPVALAISSAHFSSAALRRSGLAEATSGNS